MRSEQQLRSFLKVLEAYPGDRPLTKFLPDYFRKNKQMGSNDRRSATRLLYNYFRLGAALPLRSIEERLFFAEFLCTSVDNPFLGYFRPDLNANISMSAIEKAGFLAETEDFNIKDLFPFHEHLSAGIEKEEFLLSQLIQPDLYIRIHPGKNEEVTSVLRDNAIPFESLSDSALALPNGTNLDKLFPIQARPFEIQDISSQRTARYFSPARYEHWWDACAASGGKSLLLYSLESHIKLVVSDIRESVLNNLDERLINAGFRTYQKKVLDLTRNPDPVLHHSEFDGIILDAPCSGSGTWGRTPEMISQFRETRIAGFQNLQKTIAGNVVNYLKPGKPLIYITCSVFREENEEVTSYLESEHGLRIEEQDILKGYEHKADTMFVSRLIRS